MQTKFYLRNNGQPAVKTIYMQRYDSWKQKDGTRRIVEVVIANRNGAQEGNDESLKASQLRLTDFQKAIIYYEDDGRIPAEIYRDGHVFKTELRDVDFSMTVEDYPHILKYTLGAPGQMGEKRRYTIMAGEFAEVNNAMDKDYLLKVFHFLDECDERGKIVRENPNRRRSDTTEKVDTRNFNPSKMGTWEEKDIPKVSPEEKVTELEKNNSIDEK